MSLILFILVVNCINLMCCTVNTYAHTHSNTLNTWVQADIQYKQVYIQIHT